MTKMPKTPQRISLRMAAVGRERSEGDSVHEDMAKSTAVVKSWRRKRNCGTSMVSSTDANTSPAMRFHMERITGWAGSG